MSIFNQLKSRVLTSVQVRLSRIWRDKPFYIQSQMDIHLKSHWHNIEFASATGGFYPSSGKNEREFLDHESWDGVRRDMIILLLRSIEERQVPGHFSELGVYRGGTARLIHHYCPERKFHLFDTFSGFDARDVATDRDVVRHDFDTHLFKDTGLEQVRKTIESQNDNVFFHPGFFPDSFPSELSDKKFAFVHLDADLYDPILSGLNVFYPRLSKGGMILIHDYNAWIGARLAVDKFSEDHACIPIPMPDKSGSCLLIKY